MARACDDALECLAFIQRLFPNVECNARLQFNCVIVALLPTLGVCNVRGIFYVKVNNLLVRV